MAAWSAAPQFQESLITRALYEEHGPQYLRHHPAANPSFIVPSSAVRKEDEQEEEEE